MPSSPGCSIRPARLRCEFLENPLGIDVLSPRLSWIILAADDANGQERSQSAYQIVVTSAGDELWNSGRVPTRETCHVVYAGASLRSGQACQWKVRVWDQVGCESDWSDEAHWSMGLLGAHWSRRIPEPITSPAPKWIGPDVLSDRWTESSAPPSPMLRREFDLPRPLTRAMVYVSALGLYELRINGCRVADRLLAPEWTDYRKRLQYQTYDVTRLLACGRNTVGAILAPGWFAGRIGLTHLAGDGSRRGIYGKHVRLVMELHAECDDGTTHVLRTDEKWRYSLDGPIRGADLLDGERYDARHEQGVAGWDANAFDDAAWCPVEANDFGTRLVAQPCEEIRVIEDVSPISVSEPALGAYVFDLGQEIAGVCRLRIADSQGTGDEIVLRHAEMLNPDGTIYTANLRMPPVTGLGAAQTDHYVCGEITNGPRIFEPRFTYHGFRHVEVTGLKRRPVASDLTGRVVHSSVRPTARFECSSDLLNRIWRAIVWTQRNNLHGVPTDCPQRDERLGWTGDMNVFVGCECFNFDMAALLAKWLTDVRDAQADDGRMPDFAPHPYDPNARFCGNPGWGDACVNVAWTLYERYGDVRVLDEMFEPCVRFLDSIRRTNPDLIWRNRGYPYDYGDWLNADTIRLPDERRWPKSGGQVPKDVFGTAIFAHCAATVGRMAAVLDRREDSRRLTLLAEDVREAFCRAFVDDQARIIGDTQAGYALALQFDLLPEVKRPMAAKRMVDALEPYDGHLSTGFHTTLPLMLQLVRYGYSDAAYRLMNQRTIPSWGYMVEHGATTIWERWDGYVEGRGFADPFMNSFCHYSLGAVGEWMMRVIGGINSDPARPGFEHVIVRPIPGGGLRNAETAYDSIRGTIETKWRIEGTSLELSVTIPPNVTATVHLPGTVPQLAEVGSGKHHFHTSLGEAR